VAEEEIKRMLEELKLQIELAEEAIKKARDAGIDVTTEEYELSRLKEDYERLAAAYGF